jgi:hypothetical protein
MHAKFYSQHLKGRHYFGDLVMVIDGKVILKWIIKEDDLEWISQVQEPVQWRALVIKVMNFSFNKLRGRY